MEIKIYLFYFEFILLLLKFPLVNSVKTKNIRNLYNYFSEINLVVQGNGEQQFLAEYFEPSEILVNGVQDNFCNNEKCILQGNKNNITLRFEEQIYSCEFMFIYFDNIIELDFSNFDASQVTSMRSMFFDCKNLEKINFGNINTSSLKNMETLFYHCINLTSVDLSNF